MRLAAVTVGSVLMVASVAAVAGAQTSSRRLCASTPAAPQILEPSTEVWPPNRGFVVTDAARGSARLVGPEGLVPLGEGPQGSARHGVLVPAAPLVPGAAYTLEVDGDPGLLGRSRQMFTVGAEPDDAPPDFDGVLALLVERVRADACGPAGWVAKVGMRQPTEPAFYDLHVDEAGARRTVALSTLGGTPDERGRSFELWVDLGRAEPGPLCVTATASDLAGHVGRGRGACCWTPGGGGAGACSDDGVDSARAAAAHDEGGCAVGGRGRPGGLLVLGAAGGFALARRRRRAASRT